MGDPDDGSGHDPGPPPFDIHRFVGELADFLERETDPAARLKALEALYCIAIEKGKHLEREVQRLRQHLADWLIIDNSSGGSSEPQNPHATGAHTLHGWGWKTARIVEGAKKEGFVPSGADIPAEYPDEPTSPMPGKAPREKVLGPTGLADASERHGEGA